MEKVRYGIIGFGRFAERRIMPALEKAKKSEVIAIHKRDIGLAREKAQSFNIPYFYDNERELVANKEIQAVFITSPNNLHKPHTLLAAGAGKHVLCEKPMAMNARECQEMIDGCRANGVKLMIAHMLRFAKSIAKARDIVQAGELGEIKFAHSVFSFLAEEAPRTWIDDRKIAGGGPVFDIGVHCLDTLRYILDDEVEVTHAFLSPTPTAEKVEYNALISLRFHKGTFATIACSFDLPYETYVEIIGTEGKLWTSDFTVVEEAITLNLLQKGKISTIKVDNGNFYAAEMDHFSECILANQEPLIPGSEGLKNQVVLDAIYQGIANS